MDLSLKNREWKEFKLHDLFDSEKGNQNNMSALMDGDIPLISAKKDSNGVKGFVSKNDKKQFKKHCLTLNNDGDGGAGISYYQPFYFLLDSHVTALFPKENLSNSVLLFISRCITKQRKKFGHGYSINNKRLKTFRIMLPINDSKEPDYEFMEAYMRQKEQEKISAYKSYVSKRISELGDIKDVVPLSEKDWGEFEITRIFKIKAGKRLTKADMKKGRKPFIGATEYNNGITEYVSNTNSSEDFNVLGVNYDGSVVENFYHPYTALFSDSVKRLTYKDVEGNKHLYLFTKMQILKQKSKYQYGYKFNETRMNKQKIMLPIKDNQEPDYEYMENYMKKLELEKLKTYLKYKSV